MAKPSRVSRLTKRAHLLSGGSLFVVGVVVAFAAYSLVGTTLVQNASSLLAAASGASKTLTVTSPSGGETWVHGSVQTITWVGAGRSAVDVWLLSKSKTASVAKLATGDKDGILKWQVPSTILPDAYYIRVSCRNCNGKGSGAFDDSNAPITIISQGAPTIAVAVGTPASVVIAAEAPGDADEAQFVIPFTVTAGNGPLWIGASTTRILKTTYPARGVLYATTSLSNGQTEMPVALLTVNDGGVDQDIAGAYYVAANTSRSFTFNAIVRGLPTVSSAFIQLVLTGINYSTTSTLGNLYYTSSNLSASKTYVEEVGGY